MLDIFKYYTPPTFLSFQSAAFQLKACIFNQNGNSVDPDQMVSSDASFCFCLISLHHGQQFFSHVRMGLPGLNKY